VSMPGPTRYGIVDLHAHFPMHLDASPNDKTLRAMRRARGKSFRDFLRALILDVASRLFNYADFFGGPAVTLAKLRTGRVAVALSVLYEALDEFDIERPFDALPRPSYFKDLLVSLERVEAHVRADPAKGAVIAHDPAELQRALDQGRLALVHAVEGGFHLGDTPAQIAENVADLGARGVAYVTVAHLFSRGVATNVPALPFLPDSVYRALFPEPDDQGLSELGKAAVDAMARHRIVVDLTHMSERSILDTLDRIPAGAPVMATHIACRFGTLAYNLTDDMIARIAAHNGVMGVILCDHFANEGRKRTANFEESFAAIRRQIDRIHSVVGSHDHTAIGTDLDGFIKPALAELDDASHLVKLERGLVQYYGATVAEKICSANALRVLLGYWRGRSDSDAGTHKSNELASVPVSASHALGKD
jgi:microsomal dipeptidase-like Zn-dependent dipeptidase